MTNRKKRIEKRIESIGEQIKIHKEKKEEAEEDGDLELVSYYEKEIETLERNKDKKERQKEKT